MNRKRRAYLSIPFLLYLILSAFVPALNPIGIINDLVGSDSASLFSTLLSLTKMGGTFSSLGAGTLTMWMYIFTGAFCLLLLGLIIGLAVIALEKKGSKLWKIGSRTAFVCAVFFTGINFILTVGGIIINTFLKAKIEGVFSGVTVSFPYAAIFATLAAGMVVYLYYPTKYTEEEAVKRKGMYARRRANLLVSITCIVLVLSFLVLGLKAENLVSFVINAKTPRSSYNPFSKNGEGDLPNRIHGRSNVLLMGLDILGMHTDVLVVVSIDETNGTISTFQIPRDSYVESEVNQGSVAKRINNVFGQQYNISVKNGKDAADAKKESAAMVVKTVQDTFCITIDGYAMVDTSGFRDVVDTIGKANGLGGIYVDVPQRLKYDDPGQGLHIDLYPGRQILDGDKAEQFVRFRHGYANGDLGRVDMQKVFFAAMFEALTDKSIISAIPSLVSNCYQYITTDLDIEHIIAYANVAKDIKLDKITMYTANGEFYTRPNGASYFSMYIDENIKIINKAFNTFEREITRADVGISEQSHKGGGLIDSEGANVDDVNNNGLDVPRAY